jgi:rhodanese-related sulfurtransferase
VKLPFSASQEEEDEPYRQIGPEEAKKLIDSGTVQIIDVREPWEYNGGHVPGARLVPLNTFLRQAAQFATSDNLLFVCASGERSSVACEMAAALGRKQVYNLSGGTGGWVRKGFAVEK